MASPASVTNLGSNGRPGPLPTAAVRRGHLVSRISFTGFDGVRRWPCAPGRLCRCMVITNLIDEKGAQFSSRVSVNVKADDDSDLLSKPPQRPVRLNGPPASMDTATTSAPARKPAGVTLQDREKVRESLDEVLEKAEKLEASRSRNVDGENRALRQNDVAKPNSSVPIVVEEGSNSKRTKTLKSVWRKGNPVPTVHKRPMVDPAVAEALVDPVKPVRGPPAKAKDNRHKKIITPAGPRRRMSNDDRSVDDDAPVRKGRRWSKAKRRAARLEALEAEEPVRVEILEVGEEGMDIDELAYQLAVGESEILRFLSVRGAMLDNVQTLDKDLVKMVCMEYEVEVLESVPVRVEEMAKKNEFLDEEDLDKLEVRPPIVTIMGHVDHGKTTLLDYIRKSKVVASEAGGITQGIGAYQVLVPVDGNPQACVFLDTPGHEAFGAMRARGAKVTDICIIVVSADDGVQPQTNEAIAHAKAARVPVVIAINKVDKEGANPERVMQELSQIGLMPEMWGGDTPMVQISALKGENVDELLETVMLVAELLELKANPHRNAKGTVIEACLDKAKGPLATLVVQNGTLNKGDILVCGEAFGKIRAMYDDRGSLVDQAAPSNAVQK
ncbi:Translation initiation factor IF-2, chloroplastic [Triticum urartu]|uniref:Translation initiation factor IF-2, chloroplastic n=1 Tax=Triticum urartu TaxID=4572 RepID=M7ZW97_TRIUA|nr:Translation initiation factor IF-2, chloroplastic [Triticum urartu]